MSSSDKIPPFEDGDTSHEQSNTSTDATKEHSTVATSHEDDTTSPTVQQDTHNSNQAATLPVEVDTNLDDKAEPEKKQETLAVAIPSSSSGGTDGHTESKSEGDNALLQPEKDYSLGRTPTQRDPMPSVISTQPTIDPTQFGQTDPFPNQEDTLHNYNSGSQEAERLLKTRLEMGFDKPVDVHVQPGSLERTASTAPIPPSTPQEVTSSDDLDVLRVASPDLATSSTENNVGEGSIQDASQKSDNEVHHVSVGSIKLPVVDTEHRHLVDGKPAIVRLTTDQLAEFEEVSFSGDTGDRLENKEEEKSTPVLSSHQISEEPQSILSAENNRSDKLLARPDPSPAISSEVNSSTSVAPIPPSTPQSSLDSVQEDRSTPKKMLENQSSLVDSIPRLEVTASEDNDLSFVDDARSERSVGTSIAPIAPNSPRFISPLPTPSLDSDAFTSYEQAGNALLTGNKQPLTQRTIEKLPEVDDPISELAPELKDALASPLEHISPVDQKGGALNTIPEDPSGSTTEPSMSRPLRPRQPSSPSSGSVKQSSGWFNSTFPARRMSMEIVEGQFSQPLNRRISAEQATQGNTRVDQATKDDGRCIIM